MVTSASGRSRSASASARYRCIGVVLRLLSRLGSGTGHLQPWTRLALTLQPHGRSSSPRGRRPTCESGRCQRAWTACKYAMFDARPKLPAPSPDQRERYICGAPIELPAMTPARLRNAHEQRQQLARGLPAFPAAARLPRVAGKVPQPEQRLGFVRFHSLCECQLIFHPPENSWEDRSELLRFGNNRIFGSASGRTSPRGCPLRG